MKEFNEKGQVICQECGKHYNQLTVQHTKLHGMSVEEYKAKYPNFPTVSKSFSAKQRLKTTKVFEEEKITDDSENKTAFKEITPEEEMELLGVPEEEIKIEDFGDIDIDKIPTVSKDYIEKVSNFIEEVKSVANEPIAIIRNYPNPNNSIHKDKIKFLDFLLNYFSDHGYVENSYFVDKLSAGGKVDERIVTDISIPAMKLDIEFPNTFWHNMDMPKSLRDSKLKSMGWTIIDIPGAKPSLSDLREALKKIKLIF